MGYTDSAKTLNALQRATAQHFDVHFGGYDPEYTAMLYKMRAQSLSELDSVFTYYSIFPHFSNGFVVTVPMYTPACLLYTSMHRIDGTLGSECFGIHGAAVGIPSLRHWNSNLRL